MRQSWFSWKSLTLGLAGGLAIASAIAATEPTVHDAIGRYQLHTWSYPGTQNSEGGRYGAYRIDTQTGRVWAIDGVNVNEIEFPK